MTKRENGNVLKAAVWYTVSNFISKSIIYLCTPLYTRLLTTAEYGQYSNFISWQSILVALLTFDLSSSVGIAYIDYRDKDTFDEFISTISICSVIIPLSFCLIILSFHSYFSEFFDLGRNHLFILIFFLCFCNILDIFQAEQRSKIKYRVSSILTLGVSCGGVILTLALIFVMEDKLLAVLLGNILFSAVVNLGILGSILRRTTVFRWNCLQYALTIAIPLIPHILAGSILGSSDKVMITKLCGNKETALYSLVYTMAMMVTMLTSSVNKAWVPWFFARLSDGNTDLIKATVRKLFPFVSIAAFFICLIAPEAVFLIGGEKYAESVQLMPPLILHCVYNFVCTLYVNIEFYNKKTIGISVATVISSIVNLLLNYIFIERFGYRAAAYTTLFSSVLSLCFHLYKVKEQGMIHVFDNRYNITVLLATTVLCFLLLPTYELSVVRYVIMLIFIVIGSGIFYKNNILGIIRQFLKG